MNKTPWTCVARNSASRRPRACVAAEVAGGESERDIRYGNRAWVARRAEQTGPLTAAGRHDG
jgi:hypothetical protein